MANPLALTNVKVPRNGYCFIYLINESGVDVFFDNLRVRHSLCREQSDTGTVGGYWRK